MNVVIFGATQSGKSTLAGYIAASTLNDFEFNQTVLRNKRHIDDMEVGGFKTEMAYISFISMDRDELRRSTHQDTIGTTKRTHRKQIIAKDNARAQVQKLILIDTPGVRSCVEGRYNGIFEGDVGICLLSALDLMSYAEYARSNWIGFDKKKKFLYNKRLFDAIRFWYVYKGGDSLVIAISKVDTLDYNSVRIEQLCDLVSGILQEYGIEPIPIVPIAVNLDGDLGNYVRREYNIFSPVNGKDSTIKPLLPLAFSKGKTDDSTNHGRIFASVNRLCKIRNGPGRALRVKVLSGTISSDSKLIIGPVLTKADEQVMLTGTIKSLKGEGDPKITERLSTGTIGGIAFSDMREDADARSPSSFTNTKRWNITNFRMLKTTIVTDDEVKTGDILELIVADAELNGSARLAIENLLPKDAIQFLWFGKKLLGHIVSLYEEQGCWHMLLYNIDLEYRKANGSFMIPVSHEEDMLDIDCPVMLHLPMWYSKNTKGESLKTFVDFTLKDLSDVDWSARNRLKVVIEGECLYQQESIETILEMSVTLKIEANTYIIETGQVTEKNLGDFLRKIREFIRDEGIIKYALYFGASNL